MDKAQVFQTQFVEPVHRTGRRTTLLAVACLFIPGTYIALATGGTLPPIGATLGATIAVWSFMGVLAIIEPICYYPILGLGGTYMSFLAGNVLNLRAPVAATAQQVAETEPGTPEAEVASTLGVAGSLLGSQVILTVGAIAFVPALTAIQNTGGAVDVALEQVIPALFGALTAIFLLRTPKLGIVPLTVGAAIAIAKNDIPFSIVVPPLVILSVLTARFMYKRNWVKPESMM